MVLEPEEGVPDSDYINASYVDVSPPYQSYTSGLTRTVLDSEETNLFENIHVST